MKDCAANTHPAEAFESPGYRMHGIFRFVLLRPQIEPVKRRNSNSSIRLFMSNQRDSPADWVEAQEDKKYL